MNWSDSEQAPDTSETILSKRCVSATFLHIWKMEISKHNYVLVCCYSENVNILILSEQLPSFRTGGLIY